MYAIPGVAGSLILTSDYCTCLRCVCSFCVFDTKREMNEGPN